jgi:hypothetical protein
VSDLAALDPERIITVLAQHHVRYVLIGALAARLQGFPRLTADADITPAQDLQNLAHLAKALRTLNARVYTEGAPEGLLFDCSATTLGRATMWNLVTDAGRVDVAFRPSGTDGYDDLVKGALRFKAFGIELRVARLEDIVRSKEAADRAQDRQDVIVLRELIRRRDAEQ